MKRGKKDSEFSSEQKQLKIIIKNMVQLRKCDEKNIINKI